MPAPALFLLHVLLELPASLSFLLIPSVHLSPLYFSAYPAIPLLRQYGLLLLSTNLIAMHFARRAWDASSTATAGALALYHVGPVLRARGRIWESGERATWPWVHFLGHLVVGAALLLGWVFGQVWSES